MVQLTVEQVVMATNVYILHRHMHRNAQQYVCLCPCKFEDSASPSCLAAASSASPSFLLSTCPPNPSPPPSFPLLTKWLQLIDPA